MPCGLCCPVLSSSIFRMPNVREDAQLSESDINLVIRAVDPVGDGVVSIPALKELLERDMAHAA